MHVAKSDRPTVEKTTLHVLLHVSSKNFAKKNIGKNIVIGTDTFLSCNIHMYLMFYYVYMPLRGPFSLDQ